MFIFIIIGLMLSGVVVGYYLRNRQIKLIPTILTGLIWILLFLLGVEVGHNKDLVNGLPIIGGEAVVITLFSIAGSILAAWALWRLTYKKEDCKNEK